MGFFPKTYIATYREKNQDGPIIKVKEETSLSVQVKSILGKSQCANRAQLVRMMLRYGANFIAAAD